MKSRALPQAPLMIVMRGAKPLTGYTQRELDEAIHNWPSEIIMINTKDMCQCCETIANLRCNYEEFIGVHFSKLARVFGDVRKYFNLNLDNSKQCMPLNYHWINEEMLSILKELNIDSLEKPFLISDYLTREILIVKIYFNLISRVKLTK